MGWTFKIQGRINNNKGLMFSPKEIAASACQLVEHEEDYGRCHDAVFSALTALQTLPLPGKPFSMCVQSKFAYAVTVMDGGKLIATLKSNTQGPSTQCTKPGPKITGSNGGITVNVSVALPSGQQVDFNNIQQGVENIINKVHVVLMNCTSSPSQIKFGIIISNKMIGPFLPPCPSL